MSSNSKKLVVSLSKFQGLYFAVAVQNSQIIRSSLGRKEEAGALKDISTLENMKISPYYKKEAENLGKAYHGEKVYFKLNKPSDKNFKSRVLAKVFSIPRGEVRSYKEVAHSLGTNGYRAVGNALNQNPLPIIIPCHRVVKSDGSLGDYKGGVEMKKEILTNEGVDIVKNKILRKFNIT